MKYLLVIIALQLSVHAQQISDCGDGTLYYCYSEEYENQTYVDLYQSKNDRYISFSKALKNLSTKILKIKKQIRLASSKKKPSLTRILNNLKDTRSDVLKCRTYGSTGDSPTPSDPTPSNPAPSDPTPVPTPTPNPNYAPACQIIGNNNSNFTRIIGGDRCEIGNSPVVYIDLGNGACTGTVVKTRGSSSAKTVIFAAHCVDGANSVYINTPNGRMKAESFRAFPNWDGSEYGDVAIALFNSNIPTRSLHVYGSSDETVGEQAIIGGFGIDQNGYASEDQLKAGFVTLSNKTSYGLSTYYGSNSSTNTCFGDSGGPLLVYRSGEWQLAAVTSNGTSDTCGKGDTSNYALISNPEVKAWVNGIVPGLVN